ncbi:MAG TPA: hypothetical protein VJL89_06250 [Thermodesulfovibrionia bacterium]|nr:hypothetical protein [Thermodesulfovibrionia bacterium]
MTDFNPRLLALFQKRIDGDDSLLSLARLRFEQRRMGTEMYAENPDELRWLLGFKAGGMQPPVVVHLPRWIDIQQDSGVQAVLDFASACGRQVYGYVVHDTKAMVTKFSQYVNAVRFLDSRLNALHKRPYLFIEYASNMELQRFIDFFGTIEDLPHTTACIDIGHIGLWQVRKTYKERHPGKDICALQPDQPELCRLIDDVDHAVSSALKAVIYGIKALGALNKPIHFHLHDGHPLSTFSPHGISDHLSFFKDIPLPFEHNGAKCVKTMFQPHGLKQIVEQAFAALPPQALSFTLEIHPTFEKKPLDDAAWLFNHWVDKTNAEQMNAWLSVLGQNFDLLTQAVQDSKASLSRKMS